MSQGNQSCLRFSLEESVWFQKGQEVSELISISLDPNITIQDNDLYVTIQGALQLSGEYRCNDESILDEETSFSTPKFVQHVEEREAGIYEFFHRFPVDISIPHNRVQSIDDVNVEVESFDYVFPERSLMKLTADISITGLSEEDNEQADIPQEDDIIYNRSDEEEELQDENELNWNPIPVHVENMQEERLVTPEEWDTPFEVVAHKRPEELQHLPSMNEEFDTAPIMITNEAPSTSIETERGKKKSKATKEIDVEIEQKIEVEVHDDHHYSHKDESESSSSESSSEHKLKKLFKKKKKTLTLSEFFARKEDQQDLTRLKVCIVQQGETIDQLAERYDVPVQQLLRVNQLELNKDVYEGQVLYIPTAVTKN